MATLLVNTGKAVVTNRINGAGTTPLYVAWGTGAGTTPVPHATSVSYTHLTLPTNREV